MIILASHSKLAWGMQESLKFFCGDIDTMVLEQTMGESNFEEKAEDAMKAHRGEDIIVFTDILGGSVNQTFSKLLQKYKFKLITGMNLSVVMECALSLESLNDDSIKEICKQSKEHLCFMNDVMGLTSK